MSIHFSINNINHPSNHLSDSLGKHSFNNPSHDNGTFFLCQKEHSIQGVSILCVVAFRKKNMCGRGPGPYGAVFVLHHHLTELQAETSGWPKGHQYHPSFHWIVFCTTRIPALLHSHLKKGCWPGCIWAVINNSCWVSLSSFSLEWCLYDLISLLILSECINHPTSSFFILPTYIWQLYLLYPCDPLIWCHQNQTKTWKLLLVGNEAERDKH